MFTLFGNANVMPAFYYKVITPFSPTGGEGFTEVSGLSMSVETEAYYPLGMQNTQYQLPKSVKFENLRLKRPLIKSSKIASWCRKTILEGFTKIVPTPMTVMLLNPETSSPVAIWLLKGVYPIKYQALPFSATENEIAYEEMEFVYQGFDREL
jgi:phage tail-like protein